ncbi:hypothetical protein [Acetobacterium bakii]|uniref:Uncharacterized protein n=1 Tax=Acetobacterium bakii TaxID=52689 RepID=A0A0L6U3H5_9FIRM|nr:hypothetical protein [Acetobacterium bakii]KNZ43068.1 hypothetical protein AKG39_02625 [Acetobacterium bakii]
MMDLKNKVVRGWDFTKRKVLENKLRTGAIFCMVLVLFSFFLPFMSAKADISVTGLMDNTIQIITPENDVVSFNLGDFVLQKPIDDIEVFSIPLGDVKVMDQSVLDILRSPLPDKGIIANVDQALSSSALNFLIDPRVQEVIATRFARGDQINIILEDAWNIIQSAKNVVNAANNVVANARESMDQVNQTMATIDGYKDMANGIMLFIFASGIALILLLLYKRAPVGISIGISSVLFILFVGVGIGVSTANSQINAELLELTTQVNNGIVEGLRSVLISSLGDVGTFIANFIGTRGDFLYMAFYIQLDVGYWLILLGLFITVILTILLARQNRKINKAMAIEAIPMTDPMLNELDDVIETIEEPEEVQDTTELK